MARRVSLGVIIYVDVGRLCSNVHLRLILRDCHGHTALCRFDSRASLFATRAAALKDLRNEFCFQGSTVPRIFRIFRRTVFYLCMILRGRCACVTIVSKSNLYWSLEEGALPQCASMDGGRQTDHARYIHVARSFLAAKMYGNFIYTVNGIVHVTVRETLSTIYLTLYMSLCTPL